MPYLTYRNNNKMSLMWLMTAIAARFLGEAQAVKLWLCCDRNLMIEWRRSDRGVHVPHEDVRFGGF
jgi:hypothetical protein